MTRFDVKNYLEKIYGVSVLSVKTHVLRGKYNGPVNRLVFRLLNSELSSINIKAGFQRPDVTDASRLSVGLGRLMSLGNVGLMPESRTLDRAASYRKPVSSDTTLPVPVRYCRVVSDLWKSVFNFTAKGIFC